MSRMGVHQSYTILLLGAFGFFATICEVSAESTGTPLNTSATPTANSAELTTGPSVTNQSAATSGIPPVATTQVITPTTTSTSAATSGIPPVATTQVITPTTTSTSAATSGIPPVATTQVTAGSNVTHEIFNQTTAAYNWTSGANNVTTNTSTVKSSDAYPESTSTPESLSSTPSSSASMTSNGSNIQQTTATKTSKAATTADNLTITVYLPALIGGSIAAGLVAIALIVGLAIMAAQSRKNHRYSRRPSGPPATSVAFVNGSYGGGHDETSAVDARPKSNTSVRVAMDPGLDMDFGADIAEEHHNTAISSFLRKKPSYSKLDSATNDSQVQAGSRAPGAENMADKQGSQARLSALGEPAGGGARKGDRPVSRAQEPRYDTAAAPDDPLYDMPPTI